MKIRSRFVSNSSSSSFVLGLSSFKDVCDVILYMLDVQISDNGDDPTWLSTLRKRKDKIISAVASGMDPDESIVIPSCNYNSYVFVDRTGRHGMKGFYVDTCNNTSWNFENSIWSSDGGFDFISDELGDDYRYRNNPFWDPVTDLIGHKEYIFSGHAKKVCPENCHAFENYVDGLSGETFCGECDCKMGDRTGAKRSRGVVVLGTVAAQNGQIQNYNNNIIADPNSQIFLHIVFHVVDGYTAHVLFDGNDYWSVKYGRIVDHKTIIPHWVKDEIDEKVRSFANGQI